MPKSPAITFTLDQLNEEAFVQVDDQRFQIMFDLQAIFLFYKTFGINPVFESIGFNPTYLVALLWVGLLRFHPDVDPELVKTWYTPKTATELYLGTIGALRMSLPEPEEDAKEVSDPSLA